MSVCAHDPYCKGYGPDHDAQKPGRAFFVAPEGADPISLDVLKSARPALRKQARSGNPAVGKLASARLAALDRMIQDQTRGQKA